MFATDHCTGRSISEEHYNELVRLPLLAQEMHNILFASDSVRSIDLINVIDYKDLALRHARLSISESRAAQAGAEILRPILMLLRRQGSLCSSIHISNNALRPTEVDDLGTFTRASRRIYGGTNAPAANVLVLDHVGIKRLELSQCGLGNAGLSKLWTGLSGQSTRLEVLDTSYNQGIVQPDIIRHTLGELEVLKVLKIAGNTRAHEDSPLFDHAAICRWHLEELDLSGIAVSSDTPIIKLDKQLLIMITAQ